MGWQRVGSSGNEDGQGRQAEGGRESCIQETARASNRFRRGCSACRTLKVLPAIDSKKGCRRALSWRTASAAAAPYMSEEAEAAVGEALGTLSAPEEHATAQHSTAGRARLGGLFGQTA